MIIGCPLNSRGFHKLLQVYAARLLTGKVRDHAGIFTSFLSAVFSSTFTTSVSISTCVTNKPFPLILYNLFICYRSDYIMLLLYCLPYNKSPSTSKLTLIFTLLTSYILIYLIFNLPIFYLLSYQRYLCISTNEDFQFSIVVAPSSLIDAWVMIARQTIL